MDINQPKLWTAIITPMNDDSSVDYDSFKKILKEQEAAGNGIVALGSTGESLNLDLEEKRKIIDFVCDQDLSVPIMAGVGGINLKNTSAWIEFLETKQIHCYLLVTPLYAKPGDIGQYEWFKSLMDTSTRPCMLYNVPGRTGISLSKKAVAKLNDHKNFWAIKEASGSTEEFKAYVKAAGGDNAKVYSGDDPLLPNYVPHGAVGLVSVAGNCWPKQTHEYVRQALSGELKDQELWQEASKALFMASNPIPAKRLMAEESRIRTPHLRAPLTASEIEDAGPLLEWNMKINNWFKNC